MRRVFAGAARMVAGIAAFIEASSHHATARTVNEYGLEGQHITVQHAASGLSQTAYDLLRIGAWALVIVGALVIVTGLIGYRAAQTRR
jgi:hypothetical protein